MASKKETILKKITLNELKQEEDSYIANISYKDRSLEVYIDIDVGSIEESLKLLNSLVSSLDRYDTLAKEILARDLLETYNENWSSYEEIGDDGNSVRVENPILTKNEFISKFTLVSIAIVDSDFISLNYDDSNLFWGHHPAVSLDEGLDFSNAEASI